MKHKPIKEYGKGPLSERERQFTTDTVGELLDLLGDRLKKHVKEHGPTLNEFHDTCCSVILSWVVSTLDLMHSNLSLNRKERLEDLDIIIQKLHKFYNEVAIDREMH